MTSKPEATSHSNDGRDAASASHHTNATQRASRLATIALGIATVAFFLLPYQRWWCWPFAWGALAPFLLLVRPMSPRRAALTGYLVGFAVFLIGLWWLVHVTVLGWIMLALYLAVYWAAFGLWCSWFGGRAPRWLWVAGPCAWVALEFVRAHLLTGFPWFQLGHSQHALLALIQIADITGVYGLSFLLAMTGIVVAELVSFRFRREGSLLSIRTVLMHVVVVALGVAATVGYGVWRLHTVPIHEGPRVGIVQGNVPQSLKMDFSYDNSVRLLRKHLRLTNELLSKQPKMIVWPETMVPGILNLPSELYGENSELADLCRTRLRELARRARAYLLVGSIALDFGSSYDRTEQYFYNSAFFYSPDFILVGRYDKVHLVPFGEFTPLADVLPFLRKLVPYRVGLTPGRSLRVFSLDEVRFGVLICYEDVVSNLARELRRRGADFAVNMTNDGWFGNSAELDQHNAIGVFRAVENRIGLVRAANTGVSSFISPRGEVYAVLKRDGRRRCVEGVLCAAVRLSSAKTIYTQIGDAFAWLCVAACIAATIVAKFARRGNAKVENSVS